jgi:hypothetical protein
VEVVGADDPGARWTPHVGAETLALLAHMGDDLDEPTRDRVRDEALAVLRACTPPTDPAGSETGLVLGQVQSGKTMSFTTVAALARDNGYPLVIVVTGTSVPLSNQSKTRLERDLRLQTREDRKWQHFHNPRVRGHHIQAISAKLAEWRDARIPEAVRRTVLITAMKNHKHLAQLLGVLQRLPLERIPVLVIDDEADQAGLNNLVNQGRESTTYRCLVGIRQAIPHHTYLQYTATPQAPLLINVIDALSPRFAEVLTPGPDYVGGQQFFVEHANLVRTIPAGDIVTRGNPLNEPPDSLLQALRVFFLGVAAGWVTEDARGNRSMMVHPSRERFLHGGYHRWVTETKTLWLRLLDLPEEDPDRAELLADLRGCHDDLAATVRDLPGFDDLLSALPAAIRATQVWEVNTASGPTPAIDWRADYSHILVGGQAMDRGFTVNGLTVTYMPRGLGTGTADTIQQRARFFGYKRQYLGYCRIYLETAARDAYRRYVEHEEDIRQRLIEHRLTGRPLDEWKRAFFLSQALRPTRRSVMSLIPLQSVLSDKWYTPAAPHESSEAVVSNRAVIDGFLGGLTLGPDPGSPDRTEMQKHDMAADVPLAQVVSPLLTRLRIVGADDSPRFTGLLLQVQAYLDGHPEAVCRVYHMSRGASRERTVDGDDQIPNLFQGAAPVDPPQLRGSVYPGDREIRGETGLTVQVHRLRVVRPSEVLADVPTVAIWVPAEMAREWLVQ